MWSVDHRDPASRAKFKNDPRCSLGTMLTSLIQLSQCAPKSSAHRKSDVWGVKGSLRRPDADVNELKMGIEGTGQQERTFANDPVGLAPSDWNQNCRDHGLGSRRNRAL
jgi:hypothetical protein